MYETGQRVFAACHKSEAHDHLVTVVYPI